MARETRSIGGDGVAQFSNGTAIRLRGLAGDAVQWTGPSTGLRSAMLPAERDVTPELDAALREVGIDVQETIEIAARPTSRTTSLRSRLGSDEVEIVPGPARPGTTQVILYQDESGGLTWHFGEPARSGARSTGRRSFSIQARTAAARNALDGAPPATRLRGPITRLFRKIFKVLLIPLARVIENPVKSIVGAIERKKRQELLRAVTSHDYKEHVSKPFTAWNKFDRKRSLLIIHGIFSTTEGVLSRMPSATMERLQALYEGRVVAYDHLTVTRDPEENARLLLRQIAESRKDITFDVLCHSRGGIIARTLAERGRVLVPEARCRIEKVFFVATPNQGSRLADARHMVDMVDVFTNVITNFPDGPVAYSIEILLAIVKLIAYAGLKELPGLRAMSTDARGYIQRVLNRGTEPSPALYAAAASNYEPRPSRDNGAFLARGADAAIDRVFEDIDNDLVVPTAGVYARNGHPSFPIASPLLFGADDGVGHTGFFAQPELLERVIHFLELPLSLAPAALEDGRVPIAAPPRTEPVPFDTDEMADLLLSGPTAGDFSSTPRLPVRPRRRMRGEREPRFLPPAPPVLEPAPTRVRAPRPKASALERTPDIRFHEKVIEGDPNDLEVRLSDLGMGSPGEVMIVSLADDETEAVLGVTISAPGFRVSPAEATITVKRAPDPDAEKAVFKLIARNPGKTPRLRVITAEFWRDNTTVGTVHHKTYVIPKNYEGPRPGAGDGGGAAFAITSAPRLESDLVLRVEAEDEMGRGPFRLTARFGTLESIRCGRFSMDQPDAASYFKSMFDAILQDYPSTDEALAVWKKTFSQRLESLGKRLWSMLPDRFRTLYFDLYAKGVPRSIRIHSDEMVFPWELVVPHTTEKPFVKLPPLGVAHVLGRWGTEKPLRPQSQVVSSGRFVLIRPRYAGLDELPWAVAEERALTKLLKGIEVFRPATEAAVSALLNESNVDVLHFSGHGEFHAQNADLSELLLENDERLSAVSIAPSTMSVNGNPILYLNACSVGSVGSVIGRASGFAAACINGGFSGLLAPYWPVNDAAAAQFSISLYRKLLANMAIGEALRELRQENPTDPSFQAFAYFGDPWTRIDLRPVLSKRPPAKGPPATTTGPQPTA